MAKIFSFFMAIILLSLFYGFGSTLLIYATTPFSVDTNAVGSYRIQGVNATEIAARVGSATQSQLKIPIIEAGALLFYTGNILIDLMMNSFFAIPSLLTILTNSYFLFFSVDVILAMQLKIVLFAIASLAYFINLIGLLMEIRGQGASII